MIGRLAGGRGNNRGHNKAKRNSHFKPITEDSSILTSRRATVQQPVNIVLKGSLTAVPSQLSDGKKSYTPKQRTLQAVDTEKQLFELDNYIRLVQPLATQTSIERIDK